MSYWYHSSRYVVQFLDGALCENTMFTAYTYSQHLEIQGRVRGEWGNAYPQWAQFQANQYGKTQAYAQYKTKFNKLPKTATPKPTIIKGKGIRGPMYSAEFAKRYTEDNTRKRELDKSTLCVLVQCEGEEFWAPWEEASINPRWAIINERRKR